MDRLEDIKLKVIAQFLFWEHSNFIQDTEYSITKRKDKTNKQSNKQQTNIHIIHETRK